MQRQKDSVFSVNSFRDGGHRNRRALALRLGFALTTATTSMFKKPLGNIKTSAPLRSSDRRKLKQRVLEAFPTLVSDDGDVLVPDGILSLKFTTHLDEPGVAYLAPDTNDPLWFTLGKRSDELIPTVYTLWKRPHLLPTLCTPPGVIPVLISGADLMIPGVVSYPQALHPHQLVSISPYHPDPEHKQAPLALGRAAVDGTALAERDGKGKAVNVLHTWKDHLWAMGAGAGGDPPVVMDEVQGEGTGAVAEDSAAAAPATENGTSGAEQRPPEPQSEPRGSVLSPEEISSILHTALIQVLSTALSSPSSASPSPLLAALPIPAPMFYDAYILPSRPAFPRSPHTTSASSSFPANASQGSNTNENANTTPTTPIDIKHSSYKSLSAFLKRAEKDGLLHLKASGSILVITSLCAPSHPVIVGHRRYTTLGDVEKREKRREEKEEREEAAKKGEMTVKEMWKPVGSSVRFFEEAGEDPTSLYPLTVIRTLLATYVTKHSLINPHDGAYISFDDVLRSSTSSPAEEFARRDEVMKRLVAKMQPWYEICVDGGEPLIKKGTMSPISISTETRAGRKAATLVSGFEPFFAPVGITAEMLADELRKACACATSVSPLPGKNTGLKVLVQGKQSKAVAALLAARGVPRKWIEVKEEKGGKK